MRRLKESTAKRAGRGRLFKLHDRRAVEGEHSTRLGECSPSLTFRVSALSFSDGLFERFEELTQFGGERGGDRGKLAGSEFAEVNSPEAQRFYNYLCIALGGAPKSFDFLVNPKDKQEQLLPGRRAERCQNEFEQLRMAFNLRIMPYVDPDILVKVRAIQWLIPLNGKP